MAFFGPDTQHLDFCTAGGYSLYLKTLKYNAHLQVIL